MSVNKFFLSWEINIGNRDELETSLRRMKPRRGVNWVELTIDGDKTFRMPCRARTGLLALINKREKEIPVSGALLTIPRLFRSEDRASRYEISPRSRSGGWKGYERGSKRVRDICAMRTVPKYTYKRLCRYAYLHAHTSNGALMRRKGPSRKRMSL